MGANSKIEWTDHTFNAWVGCTKVHEGCAHCYAEQNQFVRFKGVKWGDAGTRKEMSDAYWRQPLQWDREALLAGGRKRVFCSSLSDVFEDRDELAETRARLGDMILATPNLDWLLLTKRPQHVWRMWGEMFGVQNPQYMPRDNVWLGTSVSLQAHADQQVPQLVASRPLCAGTFLSIEPMLGAIDVRPWLCETGIGWVIAGGESGPKARPCHPDWIGLLRNQCVKADVPFFFKQWGEWQPSFDWENQFKNVPDATPVTHLAFDGHRGQSIEEMNGHKNHGLMVRVGKKKAGAIYAGREWRQTPFQVEATA